MTVKGHFFVPIFECNVHIIISDNLVKSINYYYKKHEGKLPDDSDCSDEGCFYRPSTDFTKYYIFFDFNVSVNAINHEKSHLVEEILVDRHVKPKSEIRSYLDGFISDKIDIFFKRHKLLK